MPKKKPNRKVLLWDSEKPLINLFTISQNISRGQTLSLINHRETKIVVVIETAEKAFAGIRDTVHLPCRVTMVAFEMVALEDLEADLKVIEGTTILEEIMTHAAGRTDTIKAKAAEMVPDQVLRGKSCNFYVLETNNKECNDELLTKIT